ncbi:MAG: tetratricopeptide repeat protein [Candidatus Electrothrix sp. AU1_5]|nr:tetratricopeptide repeat protein [Candidatus Electrothrix gigas]
MIYDIRRNKGSDMEYLADILQYFKDHPEVTWSGAGLTGLAVLYFPVAKLFGSLFRKDEGSSVSNTFTHSGSGNQNVAQGPNAIGMQEKVMQKIGGDGNICSGSGNVTVNNNPGVPSELLAKYAEYAEELGATKQLIRTFLGTLLKEKIPRDQWDAKLREIAATHKELLDRLATVQSEDPEVQRLKWKAGQAIAAGEYGKAEELLNQAEALDLKAIEQMEKMAKQRRISAAKTNADQANLQEVQLRYAKAAEYWQKAADLLPETEKKDRAYYLNAAGYDLRQLSRSTEAKPLYEQSLTLYREIGDRAGEGTTLSNMGALHHARGDYATALKYLEQSLAIRQEIGDRAGEGTTLNNISQIYDAQGDYDTALKYLNQSLAIRQEIGDRAGEGTNLNNISQIYDARGDYDKALKYLEYSLGIMQEIGAKVKEAVISWNIGLLYQDRV